MEVQYLNLNGVKLGYCHVEGKGPGVVFLPGFQSDMSGIKSRTLMEFCKNNGYEFTTLDYQGHGVSSGTIEDGTIGEWADEVCHVLTTLTKNKQIIVGSSMGGWLMFLTALKIPEKVAGLVGIAAAPDFTKNGWEKISDEVKAKAKEHGVYHIKKSDDKVITVSYKMIEESFNHLILNRDIKFDFPIHLLHGSEDLEVPWQHAQKIFDHVEATDMKMSILKKGGHRLNTPTELKFLVNAVRSIMEIC